jgi:mannose-1-phosphate guanylyltransferase
MKIVIFAGGAGTRLWPLSRENSPKQFDKFFDGQSTIQLAYERVAPVFGAQNIYVQTTIKYAEDIKNQLPGLPTENIFLEPERRDVGPAVGYAVNEFKKLGYSGPIAIIWADHLMDKVVEFRKALQTGEKLINADPNRFVFLAEKPRFANNNLGWMKVGEKKGEIDGKAYYGFEGWKYKPEKALCDEMFASGQYFWNPGYFITSVSFLKECYQKLAPEIYAKVIGGNYAQAPKISFDNAIIEKMDLSGAVILKTDMGWSDPGTLYALKEALAKKVADNITKGNIIDFETKDSLVYNSEGDKLVATVGLEGMVVVNTKDALVVVPKDKVVRISDLVKEMKKKGLEKYL